MLKGTLPNALFENEAMNCGERRTEDGIERFALIGVDSVQASPTRPRARQRRRGRARRRRRHAPREPHDPLAHAGLDQHPHRGLRRPGQLHDRLQRGRRRGRLQRLRPARPRRAEGGRRGLDRGRRAALRLAHCGTQVELRRRRLRHAHRFRRRVDVEHREAPSASAGHDDRQGRRAARTPTTRVGTTSSCTTRSDRTRTSSRPRPHPRSRTATSCSSPRRTTSSRTAARPGRSRPGGSRSSTARSRRSCRWTRWSCPTSAPTPCPSERSAPRTGSTSGRAGSWPRASTAAARRSSTCGTRSTSRRSPTPSGAPPRSGTRCGSRSTARAR